MKELVTIIIFVIICFIVYNTCLRKKNSTIVNRMVAKYKFGQIQEQFEKLAQAISFGATLPTPVSGQFSCINDSNANIIAAINNVKTLRDNVTGLYDALKADTAVWAALSGEQQTKVNIDYASYKSAADVIVNYPSKTVNGKLIQSWNGIYSCEDFCTANNTSSGTPPANTANSSYVKDATNTVKCNCPLGYYPQISTSNNFVTCSAIDMTKKRTLNTNLSALNTLNIKVYPTANTFKYTCNNTTCPPIGFLEGETIPGCKPIVISEGEMFLTNDGISWRPKTGSTPMTWPFYITLPSLASGTGYYIRTVNFVPTTFAGGLQFKAFLPSNYPPNSSIPTEFRFGYNSNNLMYTTKTVNITNTPQIVTLTHVGGQPTSVNNWYFYVITNSTNVIIMQDFQINC